MTTVAYDAVGRVASTTLPAYTPPGTSTPIVPVTSQAYNNLGQVVSTTDRLGHETDYGYDQLGRPATITAPDGGVRS